MTTDPNVTATAPAPATPPRKPALRTPRNMRWLNFLVAAIAAVLIATMWRQFFSHSGFDMKNAWVLGMLTAVGLSSLVEAIFPDRIHLFISSWLINASGAAFLVSYAAGGERWLGLVGLGLMLLSFLIALAMTARARHVELEG
ncbi:MAG TPA: hypothetical protein PK264_03510 [Hyphomicrobiaceae bacterium]|nr:hypothetical protein [Hyphomicrobiaceae bacterium]